MYTATLSYIMENDEAGLEWLKGNSAGWAYFLSCLKAYFEYGIS